MNPSAFRMAAMPSLSLEWGEWHSSRRALLALRSRVRKSLIGSVRVDAVCLLRQRGSYPTPVCQRCYQDDLMTPGILPASASSRKVMRETPYLRL